MFDWFNKNKVEPEFDFSAIRTDMHSHIIPGIDDGAPNLDASLILASQFIKLGFQKVITTPHVIADFYRNTPDTINRGLEVLRNGLSKNSIELEVEAAAEYYIDETFLSKLKRKEILSFGSNKYLLFEMSFVNPPTNLVEIVFEIQNAGYYPVLAHPERYSFYHGNDEDYLRITELGCFLQLNTISLTGYYGKHVKKASEYLVDNQLISFIGSDMHHTKHAYALRDSLNNSRIQNLLKLGSLKNKLL